MFITFEGGEGSGKTTVASKVFEKLQNEKYKLVVLDGNLIDLLKDVQFSNIPSKIVGPSGIIKG